MDVREQLQWITDSVFFIWTEITLASGMATILIVSFFKKDTLLLKWITGLFLTFAGAVTISQWPTDDVSLFSNMLQLDQYSSYLKILFCVSGLLTVVMTYRTSLRNQAEYFVLLFSIVMGACLTVMSMNLVMVVLSIELISIASYVLVGYRFTRTSAEASLKYFLFGAVVTAITLFGMSIIYGLTGTLDFSSSRFIDGLLNESSPLARLGGLLVLAGFLFKMASAPFHFWAPDVYEAAPTPVVALVSVVPKLAGFGILMKFTLAVHLFGQSPIDWQTILGTIAILTIIAGSLPALWQTHVRRLMAYSSVAQAGFLLVGAATFTLNGIQSALFYGTIFTLSNYLVFSLLNEWEQRFGATTLDDFHKGRTRTILPGVLLTLGMLSLVGFPPTAGFTAKLFIFSNLYEVFLATQKQVLLWLLLVGLGATVLSLFFYLKIPYSIFFRNVTKDENSPGFMMGSLTPILLAFLLILLFLQPALLTGWLFRINFVL